jgi:putative transposase
LVCVTKYRHKVLDAAALGWLKGYFARVTDKMSCRLLAADGEADHVHLLIEYPPRLSISVLVNVLKGTSSRVLRRVRPDIATKGALWSPSYFAASTGSLEMVKRYVEQQRASSSP